MRKGRRLTRGLYPVLAALVQYAYQRHHPHDALSVTHAFLALAPLAAVASGVKRRAHPLEVMWDVAVTTLLAYGIFLLVVLAAVILYFERCSANC